MQLRLMKILINEIQIGEGLLHHRKTRSIFCRQGLECGGKNNEMTRLVTMDSKQYQV